MTLPAILVVALVSALAGRFGRRRLGRAGWALALLVFIGVGSGLVPRLLLPAWQAPYLVRPDRVFAPVNAIVLLTATTSTPPQHRPEPDLAAWSRVAEAAALQRSCRFTGVRCVVLVCGGDVLANGEALAETYRRSLLELGVPEADIVLEAASRTTWENAQLARVSLAGIGAGKTWLVTSALHLRRAEFAFAHAGIDVTPDRAAWLQAKWSFWPAAWNFQVTDAALHEMLGLAWYRWRAWLDASQHTLSQEVSP